MKEKRSIIDSFTAVMDRFAGPMTKFGNYKAIKAIQNGLVGSVSITIVGSIFLLLYVFATPNQLGEGITILPFLSQWAGQFSLVNGMTMNILAIYVTVSIAICFGEEYEIKPVSSALSGLMAFILLTNAGTITSAATSLLTDGKLIVDGVFTGTTFTALDVSYWGGGGLIVGILAALGSVMIIHLCYKFNIRIKMPEGVPPAIGESFSALIPYLFIALGCWLVRTVLTIDIAAIIQSSLLPILGAADNAITYALVEFIKAALWAVGLHGDNITNAVTQSFTQIWLNENVVAASTDVALPHIWIPYLCRLNQWVSSVWPILILMLTSKKLKHMRAFAVACTPAAIFGIVEPVMYGLPIVLNPYFFIPMIISHTLTSFVTYFATSMGLIAQGFISVPWCMPAPVLAFLQGGGDIMAPLIVVVNLIIGLIIQYPFFKAYEKQETTKMEQELLQQGV